jgi:hypothetical protein
MSEMSENVLVVEEVKQEENSVTVVKESKEPKTKAVKRKAAAMTSEGSEGRKSGRERKKTEFLSNTLGVDEKVRREAVIPKGTGTALGKIENINQRLSASSLKSDDEIIKKLYSALFACVSKKINSKKHIREFCGWDSKEAVSVAKTKFEKMEATTHLKPLCSLLDLELSGTKSELVERLLEFLQSPAGTEAVGIIIIFIFLS